MPSKVAGAVKETIKRFEKKASNNSVEKLF